MPNRVEHELRVIFLANNTPQLLFIIRDVTRCNNSNAATQTRYVRRTSPPNVGHSSAYTTCQYEHQVGTVFTFAVTRIAWHEDVCSSAPTGGAVRRRCDWIGRIQRRPGTFAPSRRDRRRRADQIPKPMRSSATMKVAIGHAASGVVTSPTASVRRDVWLSGRLARADLWSARAVSVSRSSFLSAAESGPRAGSRARVLRKRAPTC
jgi:hypothetical protein